MCLMKLENSSPYPNGSANKPCSDKVLFIYLFYFFVYIFGHSETPWVYSDRTFTKRDMKIVLEFNQYNGLCPKKWQFFYCNTVVTYLNSFLREATKSHFK